MTNIFVFLTIFFKQELQNVELKTHLIVTSLLILEVTTNYMELLKILHSVISL